MRGALLMFILLLSLSLAAAVRAQEDSQVQAQAYRVVNIRSGPSIENAVIARLDPGDSVSVIGRSNTDNDWLLIELESGQGWVAYFVVFVTGDLSNLPIVEASQLDEDAGLPSVAEEGIDEASPAEASATAFRQANVRGEPSMRAPIIGVLTRGDTVAVIGRSDGESAWLQVETDDGVGWVAYFLVSFNGNIDSIPVIEQSISQADSMDDSDAIVVTARYNVNVRSEPSVSSAVLALVPFDTRLVADAQSRGGTWVRVQIDTRHGWVLAALVSAESGSIDRLPVLEAD
jgi:uncharacterized protein YraI